MLKLVTSGGLGDAAMAFAKLFSVHAPFYPVNLENIKLIHLTNIRGKGNIGESISKFYESQGVSVKIVFLNKGESIRWLKNNKYDYYLGSSWCSDNGDLLSWEICPFPPIKYEHKVNHQIVINPVSQWDMGRMIQFDVLENITRKIHKHITYIGWAPLEYKVKVDKLPGENLLNYGNIKDVTDIIGSSETVVGNIGYITQVAGLLNKKVIWTGSIKPKDRFHPKTESMYVDNLLSINWNNI